MNQFEPSPLKPFVSRIQIAQLIVLVIVAAASIITLMAVLPALQAAPTPASFQPKALPTAASATNFSSINVTGEIDAATANITTDNVTTANITTLNVGGYPMEGAFQFGTAATYTSGTSITHGFAVTPTVCLISGMQVTATLTITATGFSSNMATTSVPVYWLCGK